MKEVNGSIWHTMSTQRVTPTDFVCVIEISKGSKTSMNWTRRPVF